MCRTDGRFVELVVEAPEVCERGEDGAGKVRKGLEEAIVDNVGGQKQ